MYPATVEASVRLLLLDTAHFRRCSEWRLTEVPARAVSVSAAFVLVRRVTFVGITCGGGEWGNGRKTNFLFSVFLPLAFVLPVFVFTLRVPVLVVVRHQHRQNEQTRELISGGKTSHEHDNKDPIRLR